MRTQSKIASVAEKRLAQRLMDEILQLGHMPMRSKNTSVEEKRLALRLIRARKAGFLTKEQEAVLDKLPQARKMTYGKRNPEKLVDEIIELGHMPTQSNNASSKEKRLYWCLSYARTMGSLTKEQEAVLDKLPQARKMTYGQRNPESW